MKIKEKKATFIKSGHAGRHAFMGHSLKVNLRQALDAHGPILEECAPAEVDATAAHRHQTRDRALHVLSTRSFQSVDTWHRSSRSGYAVKVISAARSRCCLEAWGGEG